MDLFLAIMAVATLVTSVAGGVASYVQSEKAADAQEEANKKMRQAEQVRAQRERMNALREARIKRAQIATAGATQGVSQSSGVVGGMG
jgi:LPS O-antigen subunit length determinant protein (WzzB/FepE family)